MVDIVNTLNAGSGIDIKSLAKSLTDTVRAPQQQIIDTKTNRVVSLEALARWTHPELGEISPSVFIPIAEEANLIGALGDWILKRACAEAATWPGGSGCSCR